MCHEKQLKMKNPIEIDSVVICGPAMTSVSSIAAMNRSNGLAVWIGQETSVTKVCITDQDADATKTEKTIQLQNAVPVSTEELGGLKFRLPENQEIIGLVRIRNSTKFFDEPTLWDCHFCRELMSNVNHIIGPTFVFTSVCKVGRATKVMTFLVDTENPQNFFRVVLRVANLADASPVTFSESSTSVKGASFVHHLEKTDFLQNFEVDKAFAGEFSRRLDVSNRKILEMSKKKAQLVEETVELQKQFNKTQEEDNLASCCIDLPRVNRKSSGDLFENDGSTEAETESQPTESINSAHQSDEDDDVDYDVTPKSSPFT